MEKYVYLKPKNNQKSGRKLNNDLSLLFSFNFFFPIAESFDHFN